MALDISQIQSTLPLHGEGTRAALAQAEARAGAPRPVEPAPLDMNSVMSDLQRVGATFNRRLSFTINEKLGQVIVKVIDADTDKVIREIPPEELQRVHERIREVIGLLLDKQA